MAVAPAASEKQAKL